MMKLLSFALFLLLPLNVPASPSEEERLALLFDDIWNQTPWQNIAIPSGFDLLTVIDYSDVGVLINNNSEASRTIGWAFVNASSSNTPITYYWSTGSTQNNIVSLCTGIYTLTAAFARRMIELGFDYVVVSSDARLMAAQAQQVLADLGLK